MYDIIFSIMIDLIINVTHKFFRVHFNVYFLFKFHNRDVNNFNNKNNMNYRYRNNNYKRFFYQSCDNSNKDRFKYSKLINYLLIIIQSE